VQERPARRTYTEPKTPGTEAGMVKVLLWIVGIIFVIGLLVVFGIIDLIF